MRRKSWSSHERKEPLERNSRVEARSKENRDNRGHAEALNYARELRYVQHLFSRRKSYTYRAVRSNS